jgi:hypothetical protein
MTVSLSLGRSLYRDPAIPPSSCFLEIPDKKPPSEYDFDKAADRSSPLKLPQGYQIYGSINNSKKFINDHVQFIMNGTRVMAMNQR